MTNFNNFRKVIDKIIDEYKYTPDSKFLSKEGKFCMKTPLYVGDNFAIEHIFFMCSSYHIEDYVCGYTLTINDLLDDSNFKSMLAQLIIDEQFEGITRKIEALEYIKPFMIYNKNNKDKILMFFDRLGAFIE